MSHAEVVELLDGLERGTLDPESRAKVDDHLKACAECRDLAEIYASARVALEEEAAWERGHPPADLLVSLSLEPDELLPDERERAESHLNRCASCRGEMSRVRNADGEALRSLEPASRLPDREGVWRWPRPALVAAAVLLAVLAYPAYRGLPLMFSSARGTGELEREVADLRMGGTEMQASIDRLAGELERLRSWDGVVELNVFSAGLRDEGDGAPVRISRVQPFVVFGIDVVIPRDVADGETIRFEIVKEDGRAVTALDVLVGAARQQIRSAGVVTLVVPSGSFAPGTHDLRASLQNRPVDGELLRTAFEVVIEAE